jgi:hypothetical protein
MIPLWLQAPLARRILFLLGNLAVGMIVLTACILPISDLLADRELEIRHQQIVLARLQAVAARAAPVKAQGEGVPLGEGEFLKGKADGVISADLQTRLKGMVEAAGAKLRSVRILQPRTDGQIRYIGSHVEAFGSIVVIHRAIHAIESAKPYLLVTGGTIRLAPPAGQAGQEPVLEVQLDVFGAMHIEARGP